jgi:vitamin B12 transporter
MSSATIPSSRPLAAAVSLLLLAGAFSTATLAQAIQPTVQVTATRTPITVDVALASVSVISRDEIESAGSTDIGTLLRREAGLDIIRGGGIGQQTSVFLRGANSNQLLVLIDGVRVASANTGGYAWEQLPLAQIERIEIVRGPRAALYGSDAIGGVIQIFTRRGQGFNGAIGVGSHGTRLAEAGFGQRSQRSHFGVRGAYTEADGFSAQNERGFSFDPDRDGFIQRSLTADAGHDFGAVRLDGSLLTSDNDVEFDRGESNNQQRNARVALAGGDLNGWLLAVANMREILDTPSAGNRFESRRRQLDWQHALQPTATGELVWGLAWVAERGANINTRAGSVVHGGEREHRAGFASWRDGAGAWQWELAGRHDDHDGFGGKTSSQAALGWQAAAHSRLRASVAEGFRAPNLNELYSPGFGGGFFAGNPDLSAEQSRAWELGSEHQFGPLWLSLRGYRNDVRDLVDFSGGDTFQAINIGRARLQGAEADWRWQANDWSLAGNLGWLQARNQGTGQALLRRAPRKANVIAEHALGAGRAGIELHAVSARPEFGSAMPGYAIASAFLRWPLGPRLDLDLRLENLANREYEIVRGFNTAGISGMLQLRWRSQP